MKRTPIKERIRRAHESLRDKRREADYARMLKRVFPPEEYPRAWAYASQGGPPGCAMSFNRALREMGGQRREDSVWLPREESKR